MITRDLIVIGGGPGGYDIAAEAAARGLSVTLFERDLLGGTCLNRGCIPTKCLLASAQTAVSARHAADMGVEVPFGEVAVNYGAARNRAASVTDSLRQGIASMLAGVEVIGSEAVMTGARTVSAQGVDYTAERIIIATGSRPALLPVEGADLAMTSDDFLALTELPESVIVIGGGVIGIEFASLMHDCGVKVTVLEYCKEILPPFDRDVAKRLRSTLSRRGIEIVTGARVSAIRQGMAVDYEGRRGTVTATAQAVLMAVGRRPVVPDGLTAAGIETDQRGFIKVDDRMLTTAPGVYAVGDCNGRCMLAHAATAQSRVAMGDEVDLSLIPSAVFTTPELAMAGLTEEQCRERGMEVTAAKAMYAANGKALASGHGEGFVKLVINAADRTVAGIHVIGAHASDIVAEAVMAMHCGMTVDSMARSLVYSHPTLSELLQSAALTAAGH